MALASNLPAFVLRFAGGAVWNKKLNLWRRRDMEADNRLKHVFHLHPWLPMLSVVNQDRMVERLWLFKKIWRAKEGLSCAFPMKLCYIFTFPTPSKTKKPSNIRILHPPKPSNINPAQELLIHSAASCKKKPFLERPEQADCFLV